MKIQASNKEELDRYVLSELHKMWRPHEGQKSLGRALFIDKKRGNFAQCGRKFGKTEFDIYAGWRKAITEPSLPVYFTAPWYKQAREIFWAPKRIQQFGPEKFIKKIYNNDARVVFFNDSFLKLEGSDNAESSRGPNVGFLVMDEFKDFHPDYWPAMRPNLLSKMASYLATGTPPPNAVRAQYKQYLDLAEECRTHPGSFWACFPTMSNTALPPEAITELERIKQTLIANGEEDVWIREYEGRYILGGASSIFPMFKREEHVLEHRALLNYMHRDRSNMEYHCVADPGTRVRFGMLFIAYNRTTGEVFVLDELSITNQSENSVIKMFDKEWEKVNEIWPYPEEWSYTYDEAAAWFQNERTSLDVGRKTPKYNFGWTPTNKIAFREQVKEAKPGVSILKEMFRYKKLLLSDRCVELIREIEGYQKDESGNIPKGDDDVLDCLRYFVWRSSYTLNAIVLPTDPLVKPEHQSRISRYKPEVDEELVEDFDIVSEDVWF